MVETLYFKCYYSFLLGNFQQTQIFYELLKEEFKNAGRTDLLKDHQLIELKKVKEALASGAIAHSSWLSDEALGGPCRQPTTEFKQNELARKIDQNSGQLKRILQDETLSLYNVEHDCGNYGRCDMVYMGKDTVYPLEIKKDSGDHSLIGQIMKYSLYHQLRLHNKHYEFVQPVTICHSYDNFVLSNLKQNRVITLIYSISEDKFNIKAI